MRRDNRPIMERRRRRCCIVGIGWSSRGQQDRLRPWRADDCDRDGDGTSLADAARPSPRRDNSSQIDEASPRACDIDSNLKELFLEPTAIIRKRSPIDPAMPIPAHNSHAGKRPRNTVRRRPECTREPGRAASGVRRRSNGTTRVALSSGVRRKNRRFRV